MSNPTTQEPPDEFTTGDLVTGGFIVYHKRPLLRLDWSGKRALFVFPGSAREVARLLFVPGQDLVSAREFHRILRDLRGLVRDMEGRR